MYLFPNSIARNSNYKMAHVLIFSYIKLIMLPKQKQHCAYLVITPSFVMYTGSFIKVYLSKPLAIND